MEQGDIWIRNNNRIGVVGETPMMLSQLYDPDQFWLPFMQGAILHNPMTHYVRGFDIVLTNHQESLIRLGNRARGSHSQNRHGDQEFWTDLYDRKKYVPSQYLLPLEWRAMSQSEYTRYSRGVFECNSDKKPLMLKFQGREGDVREWLLRVTRGRFYICSCWDMEQDVYFELQSDYVFARLHLTPEGELIDNFRSAA
jgi:hypothetical protein